MATVAVQLDEVVEDEAEVLAEVGAVGVPGRLDGVPGVPTDRLGLGVGRCRRVRLERAAERVAAYPPGEPRAKLSAWYDRVDVPLLQQELGGLEALRQAL